MLPGEKTDCSVNTQKKGHLHMAPLVGCVVAEVTDSIKQVSLNQIPIIVPLKGFLLWHFINILFLQLS
jgi:hypothetical protein